MSVSKEETSQLFNTSPSKHTYSFPKSKRFENIKLPYLEPKFYSPKNVANERSAIIGYGDRLPVCKPSFSPPPSHYALRIGFDQKKKTDGISFGESRDKMKNVIS
jgi:hypothetical protein